jgi:NitT/TauT family transport system permease protein
MAFRSNVANSAMAGVVRRWGAIASQFRSVLLGLSSLLIVGLLWQWLSQSFTSLILPPPLEVGAALYTLLQQGRVLPAVGATTVHVLAGAGLALGVGGTLGLVAGTQPLLRSALAPLSIALLGTPPIAWLVLAMVWFGLGSANAIFTVAVTIGPMLFTGAVEAIHTLDTHWVEVAQIYQLRGWQRVRALYWPHLTTRLLPLMVAGLGLAWRVAIMAEVLATPNGIGAELNTSRANLDMAEVLAWMAITVGLVLTSDTVLRGFQQRLLPWQQERPSHARLRRYCATADTSLSASQFPADPG